MRSSSTTICCSAVALTVLLSAPAAAQPPVKQTHAADDKTPLALFPLVALWTLPLNAPLAAPPAYDGARGFFPIAGGRLVAYDLARGSLLWMAPISTTSMPAAGDGRLYVVTPHALVALGADDGTPAWELPLNEPLTAPLAWDNGWLIAATASGNVLALRAADGHLLWQRSLDSPAHAKPALVADRVYVPTNDSRVVALHVETGEPLWEHRFAGPANEILALDDRVYVGSTDKFFHCLMARDGEEDWRWRAGADVIGTPAFDERTVYFVALDNVLRALNGKSGGQRWKVGLPLRPTTGPVVAAETIIVSGVAPTIRGYRAADGKPAGEVATAGDLAAPVYTFNAAPQPLPIVIAVTEDIAKGVTVTAFTRSYEPPLTPVSPLPKPVPVVPVLATSPQ